MSIEKMESILLLVPAHEHPHFITWLYKERQVHIEDIRETPETWKEHFNPLHEDISSVENKCSQLNALIEFFSEYSTSPGGFIESLFPVKLSASRQEIEEAVGSIDVESLTAESRKLQDLLNKIREEKVLYQSMAENYRTISFITGDIKKLLNLRHVWITLTGVSEKFQREFLNDARLGNVFCECIAERDYITYYIIVSPQSYETVVQNLLADYSLEEIPLPLTEGTVADTLKHIEAERSRISAEELTLIEAARQLSVSNRRKAECALVYWETEKNRLNQHEYMQKSPYVLTVRGYIRKSRVREFTVRMHTTFPEAELVNVPFYDDTEPPVYLNWNRFIRPAGLLVRMFGSPSYYGIDPTAFLTLTFLTFFGICFGDVLYGIMLIALAMVLKRKFREQKGLLEFFKLFSYAGISTILFGIVTGSWGADLPDYFGKTNVISILRVKLMLLDPLTKPIVALAIAVGIGIVNQLYGLVMRMLRDFRRGDLTSFFCDGFLWTVYLTSLITFAVAAIVKASHALVTTALIIFLASAAGLVLTQGRAEKSWAPRLLTGFISLYGIMGAYGTTAFVGDVISYSRLMALGMTTTVVGMSFNIIAGMLKGVPYVGWVLFAGMIIFGHVFNFAMSILSAFVHSARLILLEWFGRFYEGGGVPFKPFGFSNERLVQTEN